MLFCFILYIWKLELIFKYELLFFVKRVICYFWNFDGIGMFVILFFGKNIIEVSI